MKFLSYVVGLFSLKSKQYLHCLFNSRSGCYMTSSRTPYLLSLGKRLLLTEIPFADFLEFQASIGVGWQLHHIPLWLCCFKQCHFFVMASFMGFTEIRSFFRRPFTSVCYRNTLFPILVSLSADCCLGWHLTAAVLVRELIFLKDGLWSAHSQVFF